MITWICNEPGCNAELLTLGRPSGASAWCSSHQASARRSERWNSLTVPEKNCINYEKGEKHDRLKKWLDTGAIEETKR